MWQPSNILSADLVTRVLYRLRFSGEQRPFDTVSCLYMLPLIFLVLRNRGIGKTAEEEVDEQIVLALEFLSFHTETCKFSMSKHESNDPFLKPLKAKTRTSPARRFCDY